MAIFVKHQFVSDSGPSESIAPLHFINRYGTQFDLMKTAKEKNEVLSLWTKYCNLLFQPI